MSAREECRREYAALVVAVDERLALARSALDRSQITLARTLLDEIGVLLAEKDRVVRRLGEVCTAGGEDVRSPGDPD